MSILGTYQSLEDGDHFGNLDSELKVNKVKFSEYTIGEKQHMPPHFHRSGYFSFLMEGRISETINNHSYLRTPGMVVYHPPNIPHINTLNTQKASLFHIEWTEANMNFLNKPENFREIQIIFDENIIKQVRSIYNDTKENKKHLQIIDKVCDLFLNCEKSNCRNQFVKRPDWLDELLIFINENYTKTLTLSHLSDIVQKHPVHISRTFSRYLFCSVSSYIAKLRIEAALSRMKNGRVSMVQLAYDLGFSDQSHFSRKFREYVDISPSLFQELNQSIGKVNIIQDF